MTHNSLDQLITDIAPTLRKFAAHRSGTAYATTLDAMAPEAQDLYQHAVAEILRTCQPDDKKSYAINLADWRMRNLAKRERGIYTVALTESDMLDDDLTEEETDTVFDMLESQFKNPEDAYIEIEANGEIAAITAALKPEQAVMVRLLRDGCGLPEIAAKLGISYDAAWKRLLKIREAFQSAGLTPALALA